MHPERDGSVREEDQSAKTNSYLLQLHVVQLHLAFSSLRETLGSSSLFCIVSTVLL